MKKQLPRWIKYLLGCALSFLISGLGALLYENNINGIAEFVLIAGVVFFWINLIALIILGVRALVRRSTRGYVSPDEELARRAAQSPGGDDSPGWAQRQTALSGAIKGDGIFRAGQNKAPLTWPAVILLLYVLFPVGIYALVVKVAYEKAHYYTNGVKLIILGLFMMVPCLGFLLLLIFTGADSLRVLLALCVIPGTLVLVGLFCFIFGLILRRRGKENDAFRRLILIDGITRLDELAQATNTSYARCCQVLDRLMDCGLIQNAYLYHRDRELIVPGVSKKIALRCKNCSGTTVLYANDPHVCAYCGGEL